MLRMKGFLAVSGKPMRLLVQAVGPRVSHYYDRPWGAAEARAGNLVVIGLKGLDREAVDARRCAARPCICSRPQLRASTTCVEPVDLGQTPGDIVVLSFADSDLAGLAAAYAAEQGIAAERAARASARSAPSDVDRSLDRQGGAPRQGDRGQAARRARLVALRRRGARRDRTRAEHRAGRAAGRGPRRSAPRCGLDLAARRACGAARLFPRGRARESARLCCAVSPAMPGRSASQPEPQALPRCAGYLPGQGAVESRCACRGARAADSPSCRSSSTARRCSPPTPRRSTRCARRLPRAGSRRRRWWSRA